MHMIISQCFKGSFASDVYFYYFHREYSSTNEGEEGSHAERLRVLKHFYFHLFYVK